MNLSKKKTKLKFTDESECFKGALKCGGSITNEPFSQILAS